MPAPAAQPTIVVSPVDTDEVVPVMRRRDVGTSGNISFVDSNTTDTLSASVTADGSGYVGSLSIDPVTESNGSVSLGFEFSLGNDQIGLASGQTLTQSYDISVTDAQNPAESLNQTVSVSFGGPGNDSFVFQPGIGADTIVNFNPQNDTIELDQFANAQTVQELQSLITTDAHGDAVIALGHNDSITLAGTTPAELQQVIQAGHVLLH
jgi:VCBS repeat-containing protein